MKYKKLMANIFAQRSSNNAQIAVALIAGVAVGAVISILFAPESGEQVRKGIADRAKGLGDGVRDGFSSLKDRVMGGVEELEEQVEAPEETPSHATAKKPKSDIKELIHEAHISAQHS